MIGGNKYFDPSQFAELFKAYDMTKFYDAAQSPQLDPNALMEAQKKNMEALVSANTKAAEAYKKLFEKQVKTFEASMADARKQAKAFDTADMSPEAAQKQADYTKAAFEKAIKNMTVLAEEAHKANSDAFKIVSARIEDGVKELQTMASKFTH